MPDDEAVPRAWTHPYMLGIGDNALPAEWFDEDGNEIACDRGQWLWARLDNMKEEA